MNKLFTNGRELRVGFMVAGDALAEGAGEFRQNGADIIELAIPFSDPVAESPDAAAANLRALAAGTTVDDALALAEKTHEKTGLPIALYTYFNPLFRYGAERFMERCADCGVSCVTVADLPLEEYGEISAPAERHGIALAMNIATSDTQRAAKIAQSATGYARVTAACGAALPLILEALGDTPYAIV